MHTDPSRRRFLHQSILAATAAAAPNLGVSLAAQSKSANEKLGVAIIGTGGRGSAHTAAFAKRSDCEIRYLCDADLSRAQGLVKSVRNHQPRPPKVIQDMRIAFEDDSVDVVSIATCNHWHSLSAIWAMQAGKDVYVEKPVSHNISEGRRMVQVARKYKRICQAGTQYRSHGANRAFAEYARSGELGKITQAFCMVRKRRGSIGAPGKYAPPKAVDYNLFCGPAPLAAVTRQRFHYDWHWFWDFGNGDLGNSGIHRIDIARWALGVDGLGKSVLSYGGRLGYQDAGETPNTQVSIHDFGDKAIVCEVRGLETGQYKGYTNGIIVEGSGGYLATSQSTSAVFDPKGKKIKDLNAPNADHFDNFIKAVRSRKHTDLAADILEGHHSSALCHLGNISHRLGHHATSSKILSQLGRYKSHPDAAETLDRNLVHLKQNGVDLGSTPLTLGAALTIDAATESFANNKEANSLLTRPARPPFVVPAPDKI